MPIHSLEKMIFIGTLISICLWSFAQQEYSEFLQDLSIIQEVNRYVVYVCFTLSSDLFV